MRFSRSLRTPQRTLYAIAASSGVVVFSFLLLEVLASKSAAHQSLSVECELLLSASVIGFVSRLVLLRGLRAGVEASIWPKGDLSSARQIAESAAWTAAVWIVLVAGTILFILPHKGHMVGIFGLLATLSPQEARSILRPPVSPSRAYGATLIYPVQPLVSEHWGLAPNHFTK